MTLAHETVSLAATVFADCDTVFAQLYDEKTIFLILLCAPGIVG